MLCCKFVVNIHSSVSAYRHPGTEQEEQNPVFKEVTRHKLRWIAGHKILKVIAVISCSEHHGRR
jgi:hypothetical protein